MLALHGGWKKMIPILPYQRQSWINSVVAQCPSLGKKVPTNVFNLFKNT